MADPQKLSSADWAAFVKHYSEQHIANGGKITDWQIQFVKENFGKADAYVGTATTEHPGNLPGEYVMVSMNTTSGTGTLNISADISRWDQFKLRASMRFYRIVAALPSFYIYPWMYAVGALLYAGAIYYGWRTLTLWLTTQLSLWWLIPVVGGMLVIEVAVLAIGLSWLRAHTMRPRQQNMRWWHRLIWRTEKED